MMTCACGKTALYRVNQHGFCKAHYADSLAQMSKTPQLGSKSIKISKAKGNPTPLKPIMVPKSKQQKKIELRDKLRSEPTSAEIKLRELLNSSRLRRSYEFQPILHGYIPDFLFPRSKLIVEADGWHHTTTSGKRADARRTHNLAKQGYRVLRFMNREILGNSASVLESILAQHCARLDNDAEGFVPKARTKITGHARTRINVQL